MSMSPTLQSKSYWSIYAFGNHIHVVNVEDHLTTSDSDIATTFEQACISEPNVQRAVVANLEYVGWVKEILEILWCYCVIG